MVSQPETRQYADDSLTDLQKAILEPLEYARVNAKINDAIMALVAIGEAQALGSFEPEAPVRRSLKRLKKFRDRFGAKNLSEAAERDISDTIDDLKFAIGK